MMAMSGGIVIAILTQTYGQLCDSTVLLFLDRGSDGRMPSDVYHVTSYSTEINPDDPANVSLLEGIDLKIEKKELVLGRGDNTVLVSKNSIRIQHLSESYFVSSHLS